MCNLKQTMGQRIMQLQKSVNMTQTQLGELIGKDGTTVGRYERDLLPVPSDVLQILAEHFETSIDYIVTGKALVEQPYDTYLNKVELDAITLFKQLSDREQNDIIEMMQFKLFKRGQEWDVWKIVENQKSSYSDRDDVG